MTFSREKREAALQRIVELGGHGVWESDMVVVTLDNTAIDDDNLALFNDFDCVNILSLSNTSITDAGLIHLEQLHNLDTLMLVNTNVTERGVSKLRTALPRACIETAPRPKGTINPFTGKPLHE